MTFAMQLEVLTPDKKVLETSTQSIQVLLPDGWWGILPGHAPMISYIEAGILHYTQSDITRYVAFYRGTIEVQKASTAHTRVSILTAAAEEGEDLDAVTSALEGQAARLVELAKEANLEFNQLRLSLEKALQESEITKVGL
ncbi:MAG: F0F1 ATP synthase subunit epsilon [Chloroflexota bacterium]|nr:F0F1 ATP synthase subunit epsilon [Chloroflexota bacterium]